MQEHEKENVYETEELLNMYLGLHFPSSGIDEKNINPILDHTNAPLHGLFFPQRVARLLVSLQPLRTNHRALDIGCAVGGSSFELSKTFDHVEAFDYRENNAESFLSFRVSCYGTESKQFIQYAKKMQKGENVMFSIPIEGDIHEKVKVVHEPGLSPDMLEKVHFFVGDACELKNYSESNSSAAHSIGTFDGIVMSNLLCRIPDPIACLDGISLVLNKGGVLVMVTPFSWLEQYTSRKNWIGGIYDPATGRLLRSNECLQTLMEERGFEKIHEEEMPLVIREHQRKYQYIISQATGWRKT